jgi:hypothetical protein
MLTKTKAALAAALILGTASVAWAGNNDAESNMGGFVHPPSMDGVNPVYHPRWFPQYGRVSRAYDRANRATYSAAGADYAFYPSASNAYAFVPSKTHKHRSPR